MGKLIFENTGDEVDVESGESIQEACSDAGVPFACEEGVCGTCIIQILSGMDNLSEFTQEEEDFLGDIDSGERLACQCKMKQGEVTITF